MAVDVVSQVDEALKLSRGYAEELTKMAESAVENLQNFAFINPPWVEFEEQESFYPDQAIRVAADDLPRLDRADMKLDLSLFDPDRYKSHTYISDFFDFLEPQLIDFIQNGGTGIDDDTQDAIFNNHRERKTLIRDDALLAATANAGKMGFPLPTDMVQAARAIVITQYSHEDFNTSREITALIAERAQQNVQHAIDAGIKMENIQSEFTRFFQQSYLEYARQILEKFRIEQDTNVQEFKGELDLINIQLRSDEINSTLDQKFRDQEMASWRTLADHAIEKTKALIAQSEENYQLQFAASKALTTYYQSAVASVNGQINTITMASDTASS